METLRNECKKLDANADALEEEIYRLQQERDDFLNTLAQKNALLLDKDSKVEELSSSVNTLEITLKKMKAQFQAKLKVLKETQSGPRSPDEVSLIRFLFSELIPHESSISSFRESLLMVRPRMHLLLQVKMIMLVWFLHWEMKLIK